MNAPSPGLPGFAVAVYRAADVAPAALLLQDRCGVDVNVLLFAAYVGAVRGRPLGADDLGEATRRVGDWQTSVVGPLRSVRRRLKDGPPPAPNAATDELRERIKALELDAELVELDELSALANGLDVPAAPVSPRERAVEAMTEVVLATAGRVADGEERDAIETIATAAARYGGLG